MGVQLFAGKYFKVRLLKWKQNKNKKNNSKNTKNNNKANGLEENKYLAKIY